MAIELTEQQSAEPNCCGSCHHFIPREFGDGLGLCTIQLPPWVQSRPEPPENDSLVNARTVRDTGSCSLYAAKMEGGKAARFVQKRSWYAGAPSR